MDETTLPAHVFADMLTLVMSADPSPLSPDADVRIREWLDDESCRRGYVDWIDAYHNT